MDFAREPAVLLEQGRYRDLLTTLERPDRTAQTVLWTLRCRLEQGYMREAANLAQHPGLPSWDSNDDAHIELQLWSGFLTLSDSDDRPAAQRVNEFGVRCEELATAGSAQTIALAADLGYRADMMLLTLTGRGPRDRDALVSGLAATAQRYRQAGQEREAIRALCRAASFASGGLAAQRIEGRQLLMQASAAAAARGLVIAQARADLAVAELDFRALLDGTEDHDQQTILSTFRAIAALFSSGGHAFGDALVNWSAAQWMLRYGQSGGLDVAHEAVAEFAKADIPTLEMEVWQALHSWHTVHGEPHKTRQAQIHTTRLTSAMDFAPATELRVLGQAIEAASSGDLAKARSLLLEQARTGSGLQGTSQILLANAANAVGMRTEAIDLLERLVNDLTVAGSSVLLGPALALLAMLLGRTDPDRATALLRQAADVAQSDESPTEEASYRTQLGLLIVNRLVDADAASVPGLDADAEFDEAQRLLSGQRTLSAAAELITHYQYRGQAEFLRGDWDRCGTWLQKAEGTARSLGLRPLLAFILGNEGIVLIKVGRLRGPTPYDQAARILGESQRLFREIELHAYVWHVCFQRALCDIEAAVWPQEGAQRKLRLYRARRLMEEASHAIDQLRESSERGEPERQQQVWMAFSVDKQVFYGQGFQLAYDLSEDLTTAWQWLERMKSRALLDGLNSAGLTGANRARTSAHSPLSTQQKKAAIQRSQPSGYAEIRALLEAEESATKRRIVVAEYLCTPEQTVLFGARADWTQPKVEPVPLDYAALRRFSAITFRTRGGVRMMMQDRADGGLEQWHSFAALLAPLGSWTSPDDVIYLVPFGLLHDLPLHTLPVDGSPLLERNPVCYVPAAAALRHTLGGDQYVAAARGPAAVFGDARGDLPSAREEAVDVATMLATTPLLGADVTRHRLMDALRTDHIVHVAGHGHLSTADGFASSIDLADGDTLRAADLLGQRSSARLVLLSGCDTGVSEQRPGDEAVGFIRALLLSGVRSIVASQWQVSDASTRGLLRNLHEAARDSAVPLAEALRQAALRVRSDPRYAHPYHWGSFSLVGSWR
jgi:tetratricopeptide (TPR) repeat protein